MRFLLPFCVFFALLTAGCGYQNLSQPEPLSIYLPVLINRTTEPAVETVLTEAIATELLRAGYQLANKEKAEYCLNGTVTQYQRTAITFLPGDSKEVSQYRITVKILLQLQPTDSTNEANIRQIELTDFADYHRFGSFARSENEAFSAVANRLAKRTTEWLSDTPSFLK